MARSRRPRPTEPILDTQQAMDRRTAWAEHSLRRGPLGAHCTCGVYLAGPDDDPAVAREAKKAHRVEVTAARQAHPLGGAT